MFYFKVNKKAETENINNDDIPRPYQTDRYEDFTDDPEVLLQLFIDAIKRLCKHKESLLLF